MNNLRYANSSVRLMAGRMGYNSNPQFQEAASDGVNQLAERLQYNGGYPQQNRMIKDKRRSLDRALLYSYQAGFVKKKFTEYEQEAQAADTEQNQPPVRALINPDKLKQDYDDKIISIGFEHNYSVGTVFEWCNTNSYWLIYLQDLDELAYFRGSIRRCRYVINWLDDEGKQHSTYAAVRGPVETKIDFIQKHQISIDEPNHSLDILMPLNEDTKEYFTRYSKFYLQDDKICWRVEAADWISTPGILEVIAVEYYANETEDDIENGLVGGLIVNDIPSNDEYINRMISGETFIKPKRLYTYTYTGLDAGSAVWRLDKNLPIEYTTNGKSITLKWVGNYSGQFELKFRDLTKTIVVESLF